MVMAAAAVQAACTYGRTHVAERELGGSPAAAVGRLGLAVEVGGHLDSVNHLLNFLCAGQGKCTVNLDLRG